MLAGNANKLLVGSDGGVYASKNADTFTATNMSFTQLNDSINTIEFYSGDISADFINSVKRIAVGGAQDNGSSVAIWDTQTEPLVAKPWVQVNGGDGIYATIEPINASRVYASAPPVHWAVTTGLLIPGTVTIESLFCFPFTSINTTARSVFASN